MSAGETSGTTATFVIVDGWTVTVASVGDSRCILDAQGGSVNTLTVDHRLEENVEECVSIIVRYLFDFLALITMLILFPALVGENVLLRVVVRLGGSMFMAEQR